jgi:hypothetical protein
MADERIRQMAYDEYPLCFLTLIFFAGMFHFACHKWIRILLEDSQAGTRTKINPLAAINGAGVIGWVFEYPPQVVLYSGDEVAVVSVKFWLSL